MPSTYSPNSMFHICPSGTNCLDITQCLLKKLINNVVIIDFCKQLIFGPLRWFFFHSMLWHFTSKSYWKSKDSLSVKMQCGSVECSGSSGHSLQKMLLCSGHSLQKMLLCCGHSLQMMLPCSGHSLQKMLPCSGHSLQKMLLCSGHSLQKMLLCSGHSLQKMLPCSGHSLQKMLLCSFCSFVRLCRMNFAHIFLLPNILPQHILCKSGANEHSLLNWIYFTGTLISPAVHTQ